MGSVGILESNISSADFSGEYKGYENVTDILKNRYKNEAELREAGFRPLNDFSLSSLLRLGNEIASDNQPWNNKTVFFIWDPDWERWMKAAERRY